MGKIKTLLLVIAKLVKYLFSVDFKDENKQTSCVRLAAIKQFFVVGSSNIIEV